MTIRGTQIYIEGNDGDMQPLVVLSDDATLASLTDTNITNPQDGDVLTFTSGIWSTPPPPIDLMVNGSFVDNADGWTEAMRTGAVVNATGSIAYDPVESIDATGGSLKVTMSGSGDPESLFTATFADVPVTPGHFYTARAYVTTDLDLSGALTAQLGVWIRFYASDAVDENDWLSEGGSGGNLQDIAWASQSLYQIEIAPEGAASARLSLAFDFWGDAATDAHFWVDNVTILVTGV